MYDNPMNVEHMHSALELFITHEKGIPSKLSLSRRFLISLIAQLNG